VSELAFSVLTTLRDVKAIRNDWIALGQKAGVGPAMTAPVALAWLEHLNKGTPHVITARNQAGELVGVVPLHRRSIAGAGLLRWIGHGLGTIGEFVVHPDVSDLDTALTRVLSNQRGCVTELVDMSRSGAGFASLTREPRLHHSLTSHDTVPVVDLRGVDSAASYLAQPGRRKLRQNMARADRADASTSVAVVEDADQFLETVALVESANRAAEAAKPRLNFFVGAHRSYLIDSIGDSMRLGRAAILVLRSHGQVCGFLVCSMSGQTAYAWVARFDPGASDIAPGHQLIRAGIDWSIGHGMETLDLQIGDDPYKLRWSSDAYTTYRLTVARSGFLAPAQLLVAAVNRASS